MHSSRVLVALLAALAVLMAVRPAMAAPAGNAWVSLDSSGFPFFAASGGYTRPPTLSDDGIQVAFESLAPLAKIDKNGVGDVFVRDTDANTTEMISVDPDGAPGNNRSSSPAISSDGNLVAFESLASNLAAGDDNNTSDVFLRDRSGSSPLTRVSTAQDNSSANGSSYRPSISGDGNFVAFCSRATNLVAGDTNGIADVFLWERSTGAITRIPIPGENTGFDACLNTATDDDGGVVAFAAISGGSAHVFAYDRAGGRTTPLSEGADGPSGAGGLAISGVGNTVVFDSVADNLVEGDTNRSRDVFARDLAAGTTSRISVRSNGSQLPGDNGASGLSISRDGIYVIFGSMANGVVQGDYNGREDVFRHNLSTGETTIASVSPNGQPANNSSYAGGTNADGSVVAFTSLAANIVFGDGNRQPDIFVRTQDFPANAGDSTRPEDTGAPEQDTTTPVATGDSGLPPALLYGGIAAGIVLLAVAGSMFLGRRGRA